MEFNAADIFEGVVDRIPDREAVVLGSTRLTYQELDARTNKAANALKKLGIKKGSHIGIYAFNCIEWLEVMLGAYKLCAIPININYRYVEEELKYLIDNADMEAVFYHKQFGAKLNNIKNDLPILKDFICINDDSDANDLIEGSYDFEALISNEEDSRLKAEEFIKRAEQQAIEKIARAEKIAISKVNDEIVNNSINIAEKIISENINDQSANKLVKQSIDQISKLKV